MRLLVTGGGGMLARAVGRAAREAGHHVELLSRAALDVTDRAAVHAALRALAPRAVVQCAAYTRVDDAEHEELQAHDVNAIATEHVARACNEIGATLVYPSSDYVFSGDARIPYRTDDSPAPINAYGRTKLGGEQAAAIAGSHLIVRTSWLYGSGGRNFVATMLERGRRGQPLRVVNDQHGSPTWTVDLARTLVGLIDVAAPAGVYHACNRGQTTWYGFARAIFELADLDVEVTPVGTAEFPRPAARPAFSVLDCAATDALLGPAPHWRDALAAALAEGVE